MKIKTIYKKALLLTGLLIFLSTALFFQSCKRKDNKLDKLEGLFINNGYEGSFNRAGRMEKTALGVFGVKYRMIYTHKDFYAAFIEIDNEKDFEDIKNNILPIISENFEEDIESAEDNFIINKNLVMIYHGEYDNEFIELFNSI